MIKFSLACEHGHDFEGWFGSSDDFEVQKQRDLVSCPTCGSPKVEKALMAPSVSTSKTKEKINVAKVDQTRRAAFAELKELRDKITANAEDVGERFPEEARKIHYGEAEERGIYGAASSEEVKELVEEGVQIAPLPVLPDDAN
jgi:hypothetical protein